MSAHVIGNCFDNGLVSGTNGLFGSCSPEEVKNVKELQRSIWEADGVFWKCIDRLIERTSPTNRQINPINHIDGMLKCSYDFAVVLMKVDGDLKQFKHSNTLYRRVVHPPMERILEREKEMQHEMAKTIFR